MEVLQLELGERSYPIYIGSGAIVQAPWQQHIAGRQVMLVSNETIAPLYLEKIKEQLAGFQCNTVILRDGERYKTLEELNKIFDALLGARHNRKTTLLALGGGVVGDMTGFAAAAYQRGVDFVQVPTTLLAQVDSSVGGKTGVNHALGKNMIGAFHQPRCVVIDTDSLSTLPAREFAAGMAEVIKYGLIADNDFYQWLLVNIERVMSFEQEALSHIIAVSCATKAQIVAADEREGGVRAILNLGHTFGHAIETATEYKVLLHGEAVAIGMLMALELSVELGDIDVSEVDVLRDLLSACGLPVKAPSGMTRDKFIELMGLDKKVLDGSIRLVLLKSIGEAYVSQDFDHDKLDIVLERYCLE